MWRYDPRDVSEIWRDARLGDGGMKLMAVDELFRSGCLSGSRLQEFKEKEAHIESVGIRAEQSAGWPYQLDESVPALGVPIKSLRGPNPSSRHSLSAEATKRLRQNCRGEYEIGLIAKPQTPLVPGTRA